MFASLKGSVVGQAVWFLQNRYLTKSKVVFHQVHVQTTCSWPLRFHRLQSFRRLTNSCHVSHTQRPMPLGTMLRAALERDGSGSTLFDSHQLGARWAGDQPQLRGCGYLSHLRIERRKLYLVQSVRNPLRQRQTFERLHCDESKPFQPVGACTRSASATCGKRWGADEVGIWYFSFAGRKSVPGSVGFRRKNWGPWKWDFKWAIQDVVPHICELYCETSSTWCETAGIGRVGWQWNPGSICKCMVGLAGASACSIDPPNPW